MPDITTGLQLRYDMNDTADGVITDTGPNALHLTVTASGGFPARSSADGKPARLFSRAGTSASNSLPTNYGLRTLTSVQYQAIVGANNGNNGDFTLACWFRRTPDGVGEGINVDAFISMYGDQVVAGVEGGNAFSMRRGRALTGNLNKYSMSWGRTPNSLDSNVFALVANTAHDNVWTHVAMVARANVAGTSFFIDFYINGVLSETSSSKTASWAMTGVYPTSATLTVSGPQSVGNTSGQVGGYLRDVRVYSRALVAADVLALTTLKFIDPTSIAQTVTIGEPRLAPAAAFKTPVAVDYDVENLSSSAPVAAASSKSKAVIG